MSAVARLPAPAAPDEPELPSLGGTLLLATITLASLLVGSLGWSFWARLDSAVVTEGYLVADSRRKTVQHLEGGILRAVLVREGQAVKAGDVLAVLDTTQAQAQYDQLMDQLLIARARRARLEAERDGHREMAADPLVAESKDSEGLMALQKGLLDSRWSVIDGKTAVFRKRILQLESQIGGAEAQMEATVRQTDLFQQERETVEFLVKRGIERRPRLLELDRNLSALLGRKLELAQDMNASQEAIAQARLEITNLYHERNAEIADELDRSRLTIGDLESRLRASRDVLDRREIKAPQDGVVVDIKTVTPGGVIGAGQAMMDIVPVDDQLLLEAKIQPDAVDSVHPGLAVQIRLTAYKRSIVPLVSGEVTFVSADLLADPRTGEGYFLARVKLSNDADTAVPGIKLTAGMPAEVMIVTGQRRAIEYFLDPILQHLRRAFRED